MILYLVNPAEKPSPAIISLNGFDRRKAEATVIQLAGLLTDVNTPAQPVRISPKTETVFLKGDEITYTLPAASYTIIRLNR